MPVGESASILNLRTKNMIDRTQVNSINTEFRIKKMKLRRDVLQVLYAILFVIVAMYGIMEFKSH